MPFFCPQCGAPNADGSLACQSCGYSSQSQVLPPGAPGAIGRKTNGYAIASFVLGLLICFCPASALAVLYGHRALKQLKKNPTQQGRGLATAGLVLGYIGLGLTLLAVFVAYPDYRAQLYRDPPSGGIASLRTINTSEISYTTSFPKQGYSPSLGALGDGGAGCPTHPTEEHACLIDPTLASGVKDGYRFTYRAANESPVLHYALTGDPIDSRDRNHYFTDESGVIRRERDRPATVASEALQ
jgi:type IV pilus assembly protein PilA